MRLDPDFPELLAELAAHVYEYLVARGIDPAKAEELARGSAERVRERWGGQILYIPIGFSKAVMERWEEIWSKFTGDNEAQLAQEYKCSEVHIYRVIRRMRVIKLGETQPELPLSEKPRP